jgi:hypothetical protein
MADSFLHRGPSHAQARPYRMRTPDALIITTLVLAVLALIAYANAQTAQSINQIIDNISVILSRPRLGKQRGSEAGQGSARPAQKKRWGEGRIIGSHPVNRDMTASHASTTLSDEGRRATQARLYRMKHPTWHAALYLLAMATVLAIVLA